ncbi:MAG TPA: phage tail tape measure protein [Kofleriaceae bacterium]
MEPDEHSWRAGNELIEHAKTAVEALAVYEGFKHVVEAFNGVAESVEHAELAAKSLGTTAAAVQELAYSTKLLGLSSEESEDSLTHLARSVADARKGSGPAAEAFQKLGISMSDPAIKSGDTSKILDRVADAFAKLPDGATKTALSMDLFSRSGATMIPLLDKGAKGLAALREEAHASGNVIEGEGAESLHAYTDAVRGIGASFSGLKNTLVVGLAPTVVKLAEEFKTWLDGHHEQIIDGITSAASALGSALSTVADVVGDVYDLFVAAFDGDTGAQAVLIGVAAVVAASVVPAFIAWATATLAATWPLLAIGAAVAAVSLGVLELVKHWDGVKHAIGEAWDELKNAGEAVLDWMADLPVIKQLLELMEWIKNEAGFSTEHGAKEQDVQDQADAYQRAHPEDPTLKNAPFAGTDQDLQSFNRDVLSIDATGGPAFSAPVGGRGGDTHITIGSPNIHITAPSGDARDISTAVQSGISEWWDGTLRDAHAGTGGADL